MATEVRCALALNGGVSLAIWIGGLIDELLQLVNAGAGEDEARPEYKALCQELDVIPKIDVIAGTSAGGLNGAFLATGLVNGCRDLSPLRQLWIEQGSFSELLRGPRDPDLPSLLRGEWFLDRIEDALKEVAAQGSGTRSVDPPLDVRLTATSLDGMLITIPDGPASLHTTDHRVEFRFLNDDFDFGAPNASARVARACRSTASFPGAFEPSPVATGLYDERHAPALVPWLSDKPSYLVDGGVLANLPALNAVDAIISQPSRERVERVLGLVVPDPGAQPAGIDDSVPFAAAVSRSAVGIPRNQSLADFVGEVNDHNLEVRGRRAARAALLEQFASMAPPDAWKTFLTVSEALFPSYRAARHRTSIDRMAQRLSSRLPAGTSAALERDAGDVELLPLLPWVPRRFDGEADDWAWGGSPIRRLSALLVTWINAAAAAASAVGNEGVERSLLAHKSAVTEIRLVADELSPRGVLDELFLQELSEPEATTDALRAASSRWAGADGSGGRPLHDLLNQLAIQLTDVLDLVRPIAAAVTDQTSSSTLRGLLNLVDGAGSNEVRRLLLGIEVIEVAFSGTEPRPDQLLRLAQFSSTRPVTIDPLGRDTAAEKLAGVQLGHFAAFLKRSWRANDWMWGRLDASERAVRLLSEVSPTPLSDERLTYHLRAVQASILREMLPVVAVQVEADGLAGGRVSPEARVFVDAVTAAGTARPDGPVSLASVSEDDLAQLLARDQVGVEQIGDEAGSKLVSSVALTALATSTALLRRQGPRGVRGPVALMATGSMMAWRWKRRSRTTQRLIILALLAVIGAAAVAVVVDITRTDLGWWVLPAWLILILGALWGAIQAVPVQRIIQRRAASQAGQAIEAVVPRAGGGSS